MRRASSVACLRSFDAPVVSWPNTSSSAARPPIAWRIRARICSRFRLYWSSSGIVHVTPSAIPRGMIVTLCTGSAYCESNATSA